MSPKARGGGNVASLLAPPGPFPERGSADLRPEHRDYLRARGITDLDYLKRAGVRSGLSELIFCYYDPETGAHLRDFARTAPFPRPSKNKFKQPFKSGNRLYFAPVSHRPVLAEVLADASVDLHLCEGETRALALGAHGKFAVSISGMWSFRTRTADGLSINLPDFDLINLKNRKVVVCFDHDATAPDAPVQKRLALASVCAMLESKGARASFVELPDLGGGKTGMDDVVAKKGIKFALSLPHHNLSEDAYKEWARAGVFTDRENSERFARLFHDRARYVPELESWILWDGKHWAFDDANRVLQLGGELADDWRITARELQDPADRKRQLAWATQCESLATIRNGVALAATHPKLITSAALLDAHPLKLGVRNGVIDLETGALVRDPDRGWLMTWQAPVEFDPKAKCPEFQAFLGRTFRGRPRVVTYLQRVLGYCLTGDMREQAFFIFFGHGSNGKGTLIRVASGAMGVYFETGDIATWTKQHDLRAGGTRNDLIALRGKRLVAVHEPGKQHPFDAALIKRITGQDPISARGNYQGQVTFTPAFKLVVVSNFKPKLDGDDPALWRRVHFIEFRERFEGSNQISKLDELLTEEQAGILAWMVRGCLEWQRTGLAPPPEITAATNEYRKESDRFGEFLDDEVKLGPKLWATTDALYCAYEAWCSGQGIKYSITKRSFAEELKHRGFKPDKRRIKGDDGKSTQHRVWCGLELTDEAKQRAVAPGAKSDGAKPSAKGRGKKQRP